jgi:hypothetical protein
MTSWKDIENLRNGSKYGDFYHRLRWNRMSYKKWLRKVQTKRTILKDLPIDGMKEFIEVIKDNAVYVTARQEVYRDVTKKWLKKHKFPLLKLYMRRKNCWRTAGEYKEEVIVDLMSKKGYNKCIVVDDHKGMKKICDRHNWIFLRAMSGK